MNEIFFSFRILIIAGLLFACNRSSVSGNEEIFDPNLSFEKNPFGNWEVGYSKDSSLLPSSFVLSSFADTTRVIPLWHPSETTYYPYVGQNTDTVLLVDVSGQWAAKKGQIVMEGSNSGQYAIVRFISPSSGNFNLKAIFEGVHAVLSSTDVHILLNEKSLFNDIIEGYGGDPSFHAITGNHPSSVFEDTLRLNKGDILTFAVGFGPNKTFYNDTTGLIVTIKSE